MPPISIHFVRWHLAWKLIREVMAKSLGLMAMVVGCVEQQELSLEELPKLFPREVLSP